MLMGQSLPRLLIIGKQLSPGRSYPAGKWSAVDSLACQRISLTLRSACKLPPPPAFGARPSGRHGGGGGPVQ